MSDSVCDDACCLICLGVEPLRLQRNQRLMLTSSGEAPVATGTDLAFALRGQGHENLNRLN